MKKLSIVSSDSTSPQFPGGPHDGPDDDGPQDGKRPLGRKPISWWRLVPAGRPALSLPRTAKLSPPCSAASTSGQKSWWWPSALSTFCQVGVCRLSPFLTWWQHFRRIGPTVSRSPSPSHTSKNQAIFASNFVSMVAKFST